MPAFSEIAEYASRQLSASICWAGEDFIISHLAPPHRWAGGALAFVREIDTSLSMRAGTIHDGALIVPPEGSELGCPSLVVDDPRFAFAVIAKQFFVCPQLPGIHPTAHVASGARVAATASIGPFCWIADDVSIDADTVLHSHVSLAPGVTIGRNCVLHSHVCIGEDGFGISPDADGKTFRIPHLGGVRIGNRVSLGNHTTVHAGTLDPTVLEDGVMTDAHAYVAHNVQVGADCQIAAGARICGSVTLGARVWVGPNAVIHQGLEVGHGAVIGIGSVVLASLPSEVIAAGVPARILRGVPPDWRN